MNTSFFGRLTKDPDVRRPQSGGNPYTVIDVATQVRSKGDDNKNKTIFVTATAFGRSGEIIAQYFHKGSRIVVHGDVNDISAWIGKNDNQPHASVYINVTGFDFIDTKAESESKAPTAQQAYSQAAPAAYPYPPPASPAAAPYSAPAVPPTAPPAAAPAPGYTMPPAPGNKPF